LVLNVKHSLLAAPVALFALACGALPARDAGCPACPNPIVVASDLENPPFAWVDEAGEPRGRDVEMMAELARRLRVELEWRRMPFAELLPAAERGEVDVVCATLGITPKRAERVLFTQPYYRTRLSVLVRAGEGEPRTLDDLSGKRVSAGVGTTSEASARARLAGAALVFENKSGMLTNERLLARELDAAVMDGPDALELAEQSNGALRVLDADLGSENYGLALPKDRADLAVELDYELERLGREGWLTELDARYGL
jgi:polar amino acid transport system substrate-binding protein